MLSCANHSILVLASDGAQQRHHRDCQPMRWTGTHLVTSIAKACQHLQQGHSHHRIAPGARLSMTARGMALPPGGR